MANPTGPPRGTNADDHAGAPADRRGTRRPTTHRDR